MKKLGFTLIELLVTVMIVGILAAIAVPQYQRAVYKSRFSSMMPIAKTLAGANEVYYAEHSQYASQPQDLNVTVQQERPDGTELEFGSDPEYSYVLASNPSVANSAYIVYQKHSENFPDNIHCEALDTDEKATWLCRDALQGTPINTGEIKSLSGEGYTAYVLSGSTTGSTFDRTCEGEPEAVTELCAGGCGFMSATPTCNPYTGEWEAQDFDPSTCPTQPEPEVASCSSGDGTKTRTAKCKDDQSGYEWGQWDESACCTGSPTLVTPATFNYCTGGATGSEPVCVNGQWQWTTFSSNIVCKTPNSSYSASCWTKPSGKGTANGGSCTGTYLGYYDQYAQCAGREEYGCANSTFTGRTYCSSSADYGCAGSTFDGTQSVCQKGTDDYARWNEIKYGCANSTFVNGSHCLGQDVGWCTGSTFKSNSVCQARVAGACDDTTYDGGCCYSDNGYCPAGSPKCSFNGRSFVVTDTTW